MAPLRVLLVHPGAAWSTHDVWTGMRAGLLAAGCEVIDYRLDEALAFRAALAGEIVRAGRRPEARPGAAEGLCDPGGLGLNSPIVRSPAIDDQ